jgi:hypothetical protein
LGPTCRIRDTLTLGEIEISEALLDEVHNNDHIELLGDPAAMAFDGEGQLMRI